MADTQKMINFRMGELANLQALTTKTPGTIYVTTDERAMYLDVDASTRIRLGNAIITVNKVTELANVQPWQAGTMYYATEDDVLVLYTGSEFKLVNEKLINQVTTLNNTLSQTNVDLTNLTNKVGTVATKDDIDTVGEWLSHLDSRTTTLEGEMDTAQTDINNAEAAIEALQGEVNSLKGTGENSIGGLKAAIQALQQVDSTHTADIAQLKTDVAAAQTQADKGVADAATAQAQADKGVADAAAAKTAADNAQKAADDAQKDVDDLSNVVSGQSASITTINSTLEDLQDQIDLNDIDIENLQKADTALETAYKAADKALEDAYKAADSNLQTGINNVAADLTTESQTRAAADTQIRTDFAAADTQVRTDFAAADAQIRKDFAAADSALETAYKAADADLQSSINDVATGLAAEIGNRENAINGVISDYQTADSELEKAYLAADADLLAQIQSNDTDIKNLQDALGVGTGGLAGKISALESTVSGHTADIADHETRLDTLETTTIPGINTEITGIKNTMATDTELSEAKTALEGKITTAQNAANKAQEEVDDLEGVVSGLSVDFGEFKTTVSDTYATKAALAQEVTDRGNAISGLKTELNTEIAKKVNQTDFNTLSGKVTANENAISANAADIAENVKNITANLEAINAIKDGEKLDSFADVEAEIARAIGASDAMVFKGIVNEESDLPANAQAGWTYKVATAGMYKGNNCKVGDLLIALEDNPSADSDWAYVPSGGEDFDNVLLESEAGKASIVIKDDLKNAQGEVNFVSGNDSLVIDGTTKDQISISMVWGTF